LTALLDGPLHGYAVMGTLQERSGGTWRPSPGSIYPVLQQLSDEELVRPEELDGKRVYALTDQGRAEAERLRETSQAGSDGEEHAGLRWQQVRSLMGAFHALGEALHQVARHGTPEQIDQMTATVDRARKEAHRLLSQEE
jgi:DNA-binding PadR family transcriptional regulator